MAVILVTHWASMHWLVTSWLGGEDKFTERPSTYHPSNHLAPLAPAPTFASSRVLASETPVSAESAHAQALSDVAVSEATVSEGTAHAASTADDGWRRTAQGWTFMHDPSIPKAEPSSPTVHFSFKQLWPAAWAAGLVLFILSMPGTQSRLSLRDIV